GRQTSFSYGSNSTTITDPKGLVTLDVFDQGVLVYETRGVGTANAATWSYTYDPVTLGLTSTRDPSGHVTTTTYDTQGDPLTTTDALGRTTTRTYDALNDVTSATDPKGVTSTWSYDSAGNLQSASTPLAGSSPAVARTTSY